MKKELLLHIDESVRIQDDFFSFINGKWLKETIIPEDRSRWGNFIILAEKTISDVRKLIESNEFEDKDFKKVKRFYFEGMDLSKRNDLDYKPVKDIIDKIRAIETKNDLINVFEIMAKQGYSSFIGVSSQIDRKNTEVEVLHLYSSGLSLPQLSFTNKDYYLDSDKQPIRDKYVQHLTKLFNFINDENASEKALKVLKFETSLAERHFTQIQKRDPELTYNEVDLKSLQNNFSNIGWENYFKSFTEIKIGKIVLDNPEFLKYVNTLINIESIDDWKTYLIARVLNTSASLLSERFVLEDFEFYSKTMRGQMKLEDTYKQVLSTINNRFVIGELVGKYYVKKYFPQTSKDKTLDLVTNLLEVMGERIEALEWMSDETKSKAMKKLKHFNVKIGYPDKWEDYSELEFSESDSYFEIVKKSVNHIRKINFSNLYKAPNPYKWGMSPQTINAYYNPYRNEIVFPAGILQFPFFNENLSDAENFGAIGAVIGHEITHGFDDKGSQFDYDGNLNNWWTDQDKKLFSEKGEYLIHEYEGFLVNGKPLIGKLTLGENIADHGGIKIAYQALLKNYKKKNKREDDENLSSEEKFFYAFGRVWRTKQRPEIEEQLRTTDPHAHPKARVNITLANITEFQELFKLKEGDKLFRKDIPKIW